MITTDQTALANEIEFFGSSTQFIVDVFGLFAAPVATAMSCTEVHNTTLSSVAPETFLWIPDASIVACPAGYADVGYVWDYETGIGGLGAWNTSSLGTTPGLGVTHTGLTSANPGTTITFYPGGKRCRIPGR